MNAVNSSREREDDTKRTAEENDSFGCVFGFLLLDIRAVALVHVEHFLRQVGISLVDAEMNQLRTTVISSRSSIISWREVWTRQSATYFAVSESTLATSEVNDGRPSVCAAG